MIILNKNLSIQVCKLSNSENTITVTEETIELNECINRQFTLHLSTQNTIKLIKQLILVLIVGHNYTEYNMNKLLFNKCIEE